MREEIAYKEMQEETTEGGQAQGRSDSPRRAPESEGTASHAPTPDPTRKETAYDNLPGEGKQR